jgi:polysaccharide biosynthesis transport protein
MTELQVNNNNNSSQFPVQRNELAQSRAGMLSTDVQSEQQSDEFNIDIVSFWHILLKRRWTIAATIGLIFLVTLVISLLITPVYRASGSVQIDRELMNVTTNDSAPVQDYWMDPDYINTQYLILQSRELAGRVLSDLGYQDEKRFAQVFKPSAASQLMAIFKSDKKTNAAKKVLSSSEQKVNAVSRIAQFQKGITIEPVRNTRLVKIHYNSTDPAFAINAVNGLAESYLSRNIETRFETSNYAKTYLEDQLKQLKIKLEDSETQLVKFAEQEQIISTGGDETGSLAEQNVGALNAALAQAKQDRIKAQSKWQQAQSNIGLVTFGTAGVASAISGLQESRSKLMLDYQDKLSIYKPAYPLMVQLQSQITEIDKQIAKEMLNIKSSIKGEYEAAQQNESMIEAQIRSLTGEALDLKSRSIQYNIYKRDVDTNRQLYDATLQRYKEIGVAAGVGFNNIIVVDKAVNAVKFNPNIPLNLAVSLMLGLIAGVMLALLLEYLDDTLKNPDDVEKRLKLPVLGVIPKLAASMSMEAAYADVRSAFSEAYRSVRTSLQFSTNHGVPRTLLITSSSPAEGKSTASLTLARNFTQIGKRVLLIDSDMRKPSLHRKMVVDNSIGLSNFLSGAMTLLEVIRSSDIEGLSIITTGPLPPNPAELLHDQNMVKLLTYALEHFDQVIIDGPPVMGLADAPIISSLMEGVLLVVEAGVTRKGLAMNAVKRLRSAQANIVGVLINKFEPKHASYGYGKDYHATNYYTYGNDDHKKLSR